MYIGWQLVSYVCTNEYMHHIVGIGGVINDYLCGIWRLTFKMISEYCYNIWQISFCCIGRALNGNDVQFEADTTDKAFMERIGVLFPRLLGCKLKYAIYNGKSRKLEYLPSTLTTPLSIKQSRLLNKSALYVLPEQVSVLKPRILFVT